MNYLFLDSTNGLTLGLLDQSFNWLTLQELDEKKPSEILHRKIFEICEDNKINLRETSLILAAGPGSYTGMRLGEGLAHILKLAGFKIVSFYHFEVPELCGVKQGRFVTNAFKGQYFIYDWNEHSKSNFLMNAEDINLSQEIYSIVLDPNFKNVTETKKMIIENSKKLFSSVVTRNLYFNSYYFRSLDEEFKPVC